ncbi:cysteine--tRNA ligase [Spirochaeta isovalerica]|uniref:Cysteine--tRNA ligase n=1 Tax=Spirochaeta isovalerica TaxID=150 RepID=A0A841R0G0_9SPIO|nr:cysteine--tRNA ligase [Spirochaeta isovalerica]MBB6478424.1 cysteinyl-tRNA synthetase [Spirochaeta isovalerica]
MTVNLYNTDGRKIEPFIPIREGNVGLYCCGPTVYNYAHIGNLRAFMFEDILRRTLEYAGYKVKHIMNITDVGHLTDDGDDGEDKMIKAAREKGMSVWDIAAFFTDSFFSDVERLNIQKPTLYSKATDHIEDMINMIRTLEEKGFTYQAGGNVYFDSSRFPEYGKMALLDKQDLQHGARVVVDENKRNPQDFVLWFTESKFEKQAMTWDSPWGVGYPGWHIECSAMSCKYLGNHFDIHCGGIDHIPVHHTNEIAQSEAANGEKWVNYWCHNEFLLMKSGKMSKSKGGFLTLQSLVDKGYDPLDYRYFLLGGHYRSQLVFSWESLEASASARKNLIQKIGSLRKDAGPVNLSDLGDGAKEKLNDFSEHITADLMTPRCLADLWGLLKDPAIAEGEKLAAAYEMDRVLGLKMDTYEIAEESVEISEEDKALIGERAKAKKEKNFSRADEIRDIFSDRGYTLVDTPEGTILKKK